MGCSSIVVETKSHSKILTQIMLGNVFRRKPNTFPCEKRRTIA